MLCYTVGGNVNEHPHTNIDYVLQSKSHNRYRFSSKTKIINDGDTLPISFESSDGYHHSIAMGEKLEIF